MPRQPEHESDIKRLAATGMSHKDIAQRLQIGLSTVYKYAPGRQAGPGKKRRGGTLSVPLGSAAAPAADETERAVLALTHEEMVALGQHPTIVAGQIIADSLRQRLLKKICESGPYPDVLTLMRDTRRAGDPRDNFGAHEVVHIIRRSLNVAGLVDYVEDRQGNVTKIRATERGYEAAGYGTRYREVRRQRGGEPQRRSDRTDFRTHRPRAEGGEIMREPLRPDHIAHFPDHAALHGEPIAAGPEPAREDPQPASAVSAAPVAVSLGDFPLLTELLDRARKAAEASEYLLKAAELTGDESLLERAVSLQPTYTDLEAEYLRLAREAGIE